MALTKERRRTRGELARRVRRRPVAGVHVTTASEGRALFDHQATKVLGISGDEFLRRWDAGEYRNLPDADGARKIRRLAMLIPFARRTPVEG